MKVTADVVKNIPRGTAHTFKVDTPRDLNTARSIANYVSKFYPELGVKFTTSVNYPTNEITITSVILDKAKKH